MSQNPQINVRVYSFGLFWYFGQLEVALGWPNIRFRAESGSWDGQILELCAKHFIHLDLACKNVENSYYGGFSDIKLSSSAACVRIHSFGHFLYFCQFWFALGWPNTKFRAKRLQYLE